MAFKPTIINIVQASYFTRSEDLSKIGGIINCYDGVSEMDPGAVLPIPKYLDAAEFNLIDKAPLHVSIGVLGHRVMRRQWGWGCDLYVRKKNDRER